ncbi:MAG: cell division protein ZapA [Clostridia bacterium]|nr:cell division protein ZapA [Clostridia bacterium]
MDNNTKKRIPVEIAGTPLTIVTDEPEEFVKLLASQLDRRITSLTKNSFRISQLDAALLCALDAMGDKFKYEKRIRTLEAQAQVYEMDLENLRGEIDALNAKIGTPESERVMQETETISSRLRDSSDASAEDKVHALEKYLESKKSADAKPYSAHTREEKIRYIESLLRGNEKSDSHPSAEL